MKVITTAFAMLTILAIPALAQSRPPAGAPFTADMLPGPGIEVIPLPDRNLLVLIDQRSRQVALCRFTLPTETDTVPSYSCTHGFSPFPK